MTDLRSAACTGTPRNFMQSEWNIYMEDNRFPICFNAPIQPDGIDIINVKASDQIRLDHVVSGTQRLEQLNGWLQENGQFKNYGVDVEAWVNEIVATATAEALPLPTATPAPSATSTPP